jgi:hypothetical protein
MSMSNARMDVRAGRKAGWLAPGGPWVHLHSTPASTSAIAFGAKAAVAVDMAYSGRALGVQLD